MSDNEFEKNEGGSLTFPSSAGDIKKGSYMLIKGKPCKVVEVTTSKTGKHGHAKCSITGIDIFTNKKLEDSVPSSHNVECPNINKTEYELISIDEDGYCSLLQEDGEYKEDLKLPEDETEMVEKIRKEFDAGSNLIVCVIAAMEQEKIITFRKDTS